MPSREHKLLVALCLLVLLLAVASLLVGSVAIPPLEVCRMLMGREPVREGWAFILWELRLPGALTAMLCGAALSACGLMLQTAFKNPLAGPSILGISSGAGLGAALVMLLFGGTLAAGSLSLSGYIATLLGAAAGAGLVMAVILFFSTVVRSNVMLLLIGIMVGYLASSAVSLLNFFATAEGVRSYLIWGMGSFSGVSSQQLPVFVGLLLMGIVGALLLIKPLNLLLLGEQYARNLGLNLRRIRGLLLLTSGLLTAVTTAFCGPVAFLGLAVPHIARLLLRTSNHRYLLPATMLCGSAVALLCNLLCLLPGESGIIPLNAVTPFIGAPVIIYVIVSSRRSGGLS